MKIFKIQVENYRLLKHFSLDLEEELSLVIGKNNTGKTSVLSVLDKFLNQSERNKFYFDDFNIDFKKELKELIEGDFIAENDYIEKGIKLKLFIQYTNTCNLENVSKVMMDLDPDNNYIVLGFEYLLSFEKYIELRKDYSDFVIHEAGKLRENADYKQKSLYDLLRKKHTDYFKRRSKSVEIDKDTLVVNENNFIDLKDESINVQDIVNFKYISAKREVANKDVDKTLSSQTSKIYEKTEVDTEQEEAIEEFQDKLSDTDSKLTEIYNEKLFNKIIKKISDFGGIKPSESEIEIISNLQHRELLSDNTTVVYRHDEANQLPEHYNGLGYMNLICMIFEIEILVQEFKREKEKKPADINLLFIEEPEAHTHPQMQYVFIKNIKNLLKEGIRRGDGEHRALQYIVSSHSSYIVADSDFDDIKYLKKENTNSVVAKNLKDLKKEYDEKTPQYQFLTQYLTINRAEIFFAEKAVLIEGDTERMLVPTIMRKIDIEEAATHEKNKTKDNFLPLLSQNISIVEVGAYSQIFDKFIEFLGIKTLIITDLDTVGNDGKKCEVANGVSYSNEAISHYFDNPTLANLKTYSSKNKLFNKLNGIWTNQPDGKLCVVYQTEENGYNARSFEDAFIHINRGFVKDNKENFKGLQNRNDFNEPANNAYHLAKECIKKKTHFALDILFHSDKSLSNWQIPLYIKEGLLWLKED